MSNTPTAGNEKTEFFAFVAAIALAELAVMLMIEELALDGIGIWLPAIFDAATLALVAVILFSYFIGRHQDQAHFGVLSPGTQLGVGVVVFSIEILLMAALALLPAEQSPWLIAIINALALSIVSGSIIYWKIYLPSTRHTTTLPAASLPVSLFWSSAYTYLALMSFISIIFLTLFDQQQQQLLDNKSHEEVMRLESVRRGFLGDIHKAAISISLLARQADLQEYSERLSQADHWLRDHTEKGLRADYRTVLEVMPAFETLSFIDSQGVERIHLDRQQQQSPSSSAVASAQQRRDDIAKAMQASQGEIYISELNVHSQQGPDPLAQTPNIRLATPVFDHRGIRRGLIIVSLAAQQMLDSLAQPALGQLALLQAEGFWLYGASAARGENLPSEQVRQPSFAASQPEVWQQMQMQSQGSVKTAEGLYTYRNASPLDHPLLKQAIVKDPTLQPPQWWLVGFIGKSALESDLKKLGFLLQGMWLLFALLAALATALFSYAFRQQIEADHKLQKLAHSDFLTGLANRALFARLLDKELHHSQRNHFNSALLYMDLDNFKPINDELGHEAGDEALKQVAQRLLQSVRTYDTVARLGGDEFAILIPGPIKQQDVEELARRVLDAFRQPFEISGQQCQMGTSIGATLLPNGCSNQDQALDAADSAMYQVKSSGKNSFSIAPINPPSTAPRTSSLTAA